MHRAHVQKATLAARLARATCLVMPIARIPHKPEAADIEVRLAIIRAQLAAVPQVHVVEECPELHSENYMFELASKPGDEVFSLQGCDSFNNIAELTCAANILNRTTVIVAARDGYALGDVNAVTRGHAHYKSAKSLDPRLDPSDPAVRILDVWHNLADSRYGVIYAALGDLTLSSQTLRSTEIGQAPDLTAFFTDPAIELIREHYVGRKVLP